MKNTFLFLFILISHLVFAQSKLVHVKLNHWAKDERFDRAINPIAFYYTAGDTIMSYDVENLKDPSPIVIKRPPGYKTYAYGYLFFAGVPNKVNNGMMNLLLVNVADRDPKLYVDRNNNFDFTDDGLPERMPAAYFMKDSAIVEFNRLDKTGGGIAIQFSRINFINKYAYKTMLNEFYEFFYNDRKFVGIDYCFREQRFVVKSGVFKTETDSFNIALFDANSNGLYNNTDTDMIVTCNYGDSIFDTKDELHAFKISKDKTNQYLERNGEQYEILEIDPEGKYIVFKQADSTQLFDKIPAGKKVPKFSFYDWEGNKHKIKHYKRKQVYIYFTNPLSNSFKSDTIALRKLANDFKDELTVLAFIDVNKSYELKIFGTYANLNWIAAFKDKYVIQQLKLRGIPSSLWLGKKRKVIKYNITPESLLNELKLTR